MALPCRISVFEQEGKVKIGMIRPTALLDFFPHTADLKPVAEEVDAETKRMIDQAR